METYEAMQEGSYGYSENSYRNGRRSYEYNGGSYRDGRRGRDADNDGRYSERGYRSYDGYSGHDASTTEHLEDMLRSARSEAEREQIRRWMREANS